jgi:hypothetical protein
MNQNQQFTGPACSAPLALAGDVQGLLTQNTVVALQGTKMSADKPASGQVLQYLSGAWTPANATAFGVISVDLNTGLTLTSENRIGINCATLAAHCNLLTNELGDTKYLAKTGGVISGTLSVTGVTQLTTLSTTGALSFQNLSGTGTRQLVVDATGAVSAQALSNTIYNGNSNGSGAKIFTSKDSNNTFQFNSLVAGDSNTLVTEGSGFVTIRTLGEINDITPLGALLPNSANVYAGAKIGTLLPLKTIQGSTGILISGTDPNKITITNTMPGVINTGINLGSAGAGTGQPFTGMAGNDLTFKSIIGNTSPTAVTNITQSGNDIRVSVDAVRDLAFNETTRILSITGGVSANLSSLASGFTTLNTSSASATLASNILSVTVPFRYNGALMSSAAGSTTAGLNITSSGNTITITNPTPNTLNVEAISNSTAPGFSSVGPASGTTTAIVGTNTENILFTGTFTSSRDVILSATNATLGRSVIISTLNATVGAFPLSIKDATQANAVIDTISTATSAEYRFNGLNWVEFR